MDDGRDAVPPLLGDIVDEQHVGAGQRPVEELRGPLGQHHGRDGAELLAALDGVEAFEVRGAARVGEQ